MTSQNAASLTPIESDFYGTRTPTLLLFSRRGQAGYYDLFDNGGNYNACIAGASGSGKSVFTNEFAVSIVSTGGKVRIIDVGRSYQNTCQKLGGQFIEFSRNTTLSLNPFSKITNIKEELEILSPLFGQMVSPSKDLDDWEKQTLERTIEEVFVVHGTKTTIDDIASALKAHEDIRGRDLGTQLFSYTSVGRRGKFFMGENNCDFNNPLVLLELEELKSDPDLQKVILLLILYNIGQEVYFSDRNSRIVVIIDEAWSLLGDGPAAKFIETAYRRFRKYGGAIITVTQGINDFYKSAATRACFENSDWMFLLAQKPESINALKESGRVDLSPAEFNMLSTVHTISGQYSEIFVSCKDLGRSIGRMYIDPFSYWLYTTNPREHALREAFLALNLPLDNAIEACIGSKDEMAGALKDGCTVEQAVLRCVRKYPGNSRGENKPRELIHG
jgi:conjugal transfer ATP-binding protein TraC